MAVLFCLFAFAGSLSAQNATVNETVTFKVENGNGDYTWPVPTNHGTISTNYYTFDGAEGGQVADCIPQANATAGGNGSKGSYGLLTTHSGDGGYAAGPAGLAGDGGHTSDQSYFLSDGTTGNPGFNYGGGGSGAQGYSVRTGRNIERNGGTGADGVVRVTYAYEIDANVQTEDAVATVCNDMTFELPLNIVLTNLTYDDIAFDFNQIIFVSEYVTRIGEFSVDENFVLTGKFHNSAAEAKPYVLTVSIRTSGNNPTELASLIVNFNVYDSLKVGSVTLDDNACNNAIVVMGEATGGSGTYTYAWLDDNQLIPDANGLSYSPTSDPTHYISGVVNDVVCGTADTSRPAVTVIYHHSAHPIDPGIIGRNDTIVCPNNTYTTTLYANTTASGTIQWQRKYNDNEWQNVISHGPSHGTGSYNVLIHASQFDTVNTAKYRYLVKPNNCDDYIPCNDVFTVSKKIFPAYEAQIRPVTVTLPYGECTFDIDSLKAPVLPETEVDTVYLAEDQEKYLAPSETPYKVVWNVVDVECGVITPNTQLVTVQFPVCGEGFVAEDAENNSYETVRIGCDCWMAENLRTSAANAVYYDEDAENEDFGMLYSLADVFPPMRAITPENAPIQGICPEGWAVPTLAQYNAMMAIAGSVENLKATTGWLPEYVGTNETGFTAIAPGFYNASADQFQKHLTFAGFWTSSRSDVAGTGVIFEINYNCDNGTPSGAPEANKYSVRCVKVNIDEE